MKNIKPIYFIIITIFTLLIVCGFQKNPNKREDSINVVYYKMGLYSDGIKKEEKLPENVQKNLDEYSKTMEDIEFGLYFTKEIKLVSSVTEEKELSPCAKVYLDTYQEFVDLELEGEAGAEAWAAYKDCLSGKY